MHMHMCSCMLALKGFGSRKVLRAGVAVARHGPRTELQRMPAAGWTAYKIVGVQRRGIKAVLSKAAVMGPDSMEVELLCLNESLSDSGSPPSIYFNSLFMPDALQRVSTVKQLRRKSHCARH